MPVRIWPRIFEKKEHINSGERFLLRNAAKNLKEGCFVVGIDPVGFSTEQIHMGMYISPNEGLVTFSIVQGKIKPESIDQYIMTANMVEFAVCRRLLDSRMLIVRDGDKKELKFPYKHIFLFPDEDIPVNSCRRSDLFKLAPYSALRFFIPTMSTERPKFLKDLKIFENIRLPYDSHFSELSDSECLAIFERLAPEYTVVLKDQEDVEIKVTSDDLPSESESITGKEVEFKTFYLDEDQVAMINDMGHGHRVILANAGAGKSVLLLSKAFKYASMYKDKNILLTCYNNNLADSYRFKMNCAGLNNDPHRKLFVLTLHKLVAKLFKEELNRTVDGFATEQEIRECIDLVKRKRIKTRFKAIFVDEVQIFTPDYLELCYALLEKPEEDLFLLAGDLNQTVRTQSRRGDAPWKKIADGKLNFAGRVTYIKKNYRNSPQISQFLNRMLVYMNTHLNRFKMINIDEFEYDIMSDGASNNVAMKIKTAIDRHQIQMETINAVTEIVEKYHIPYSDIAILYPMKENKALKYYPQFWIREALEDANVPFSFISSTDDSFEKTSFSNTSGVVLSSIDSSLGLDFRAVVITGLYPYSFVFDEEHHRTKLKGWELVPDLSDHEKESLQIQMRKLYTACSRAREILYVVSDVSSGTIIDSVIRSGEQS